MRLPAGGSLLAGLVLALAPGAAPAQEGPGLGRVDSLVAEGRAEEARAVLVAWWESTRPGASREDAQRALWLRGLLTVDPAQATVDYQRLVLEYPGGPFSGRALLRLAQGAEAEGQPARAAAHLRTLLRDYPDSPLRLEAGRLLERVEAAAARAPAPAPAVVPPTPSTPSPAAPAAEAGRWTVQMGAFSSDARARRLRDELAAQGIEARLVTVPGSALVRVRAGRFPEEADAQALRRSLATRGVVANVAGDADRERPVR